VQQHPQVRLEVNIANRNVDLVAEGFDLAIRLGPLPDSGLVARKLEDAALCVVASPEYLQRHGTPSSLDALARHVCLPFVMPSSGRLAPWLFRNGTDDVEWLPESRITVSDDVLGVVSLAQRGAGICQTYDFVVEEPLRAGRLVEVLPALRGRSRMFSMIYAPHRRLSAAARALIDALAAPSPT
jgi:DNA-binding transcriptional LysR family regulator